MTEKVLKMLNLITIGTVKSNAGELVDENWGKVISEIHLEPEFSQGLTGLEKFSHALVIFFMDKSSFNPATDLLRHPRGNPDLPLCGIFSQRAKHRPNPIGITAVEILSVKDNILTVKGLDAINGTPVIDIKPYFPVFDRVENAINPDWVTVIMQGYF
jgi:tRNA-Thr(GGU) m(6)t(6)A37 methyltransferase TsaA